MHLSDGVCRLRARVQLKTLSSLLKATAKRSQHANPTYRNIVGRNMLRAFGHPVATCCDVLGVVGSNLTIFKPEPTTSNMSQHIATRWPNARNMLRSFGRGLRWLPRVLLGLNSARYHCLPNVSINRAFKNDASNPKQKRNHFST